jgi:hypothetical protein
MGKAGIFLGLTALVLSVFGQQRMVLIEDFSASTCPPCAGFDQSTLDPFLADTTYTGKCACVSYRANWPGNGDPYYTAEAGTRISFYAVDSYGVPDVFIANTSPNTGSLSSFKTKINSVYATAPKATITSTYKITGTTVATGKAIVTATVTPTAAFTGGFLYAAVCEKTTTKNVATNGETEFHHVMMKMVPNASGHAITLAANTPVTVVDSASLSGTHIEEMSDLEVVVWVQINSTKEILQTAMGVVNVTPVQSDKQVSPAIGFSIVQNRKAKRLVVSNAENAVVTLRDLSGRLAVRATAGVAPQVDLDVAKLSQGCYVVSIARQGAVYTKRITISQ